MFEPPSIEFLAHGFTGRECQRISPTILLILVEELGFRIFELFGDFVSFELGIDGNGFLVDFRIERKRV